MEDQISTMSEKLLDLQEKYLNMQEQTTKDISELNSVVDGLLDNAGLVRRTAAAVRTPNQSKTNNNDAHSPATDSASSGPSPSPAQTQSKPEPKASNYGKKGEKKIRRFIRDTWSFS